MIAVLVVTATAAFGACSGQKGVEKELVGTWLTPIEGQEGSQGFELKADGTAASVNMATLQVENWKVEGENLILQVRSIGNGQTIESSDTVRIVSVAADKLEIKVGELSVNFEKQASE